MKYIKLFEALRQEIKEDAFSFEADFNPREGIISIPIIGNNPYTYDEFYDRFEESVPRYVDGVGDDVDYREYFDEYIWNPMFSKTFVVKYDSSITDFEKIFQDWGTIYLPDEVTNSLDNIINYIKDQDGVIDAYYK
jgi:hypothetical protein